MKIGTTEKLKFKNLQRRLRLPLWQAVGLLECLWKVAYRNAPAGDIGRLSNDEIAAAIEWEGDAAALVDALVETRWLDRDETHRLLIHDWSDECEAWLRGNFERNKKQFAKAAHPKPPEYTNGDLQPTKQTTSKDREQASNKPSLSSPSLSFPPPPPLSSWEAVEADLLKFGVSEAAEVVRAVRDAGCSIVQVCNVMEFWRGRQPAWGPGALYERLLRYRPDQSFDSLWPPVSPAAKQQASQAAQIEKQRQASEQRRKAKQQHEADDREAQRLETEFGKTLDALDRSAVKKLIGDIYPENPTLMIGRLRENGPDGPLRVELLHEIERRWQEETA